MAAGSAMAMDMPDIAKKNGCTECHAIDKKVGYGFEPNSPRTYPPRTRYKQSSSSPYR